MNDSDIEYFRNQTRAQIEQLRNDIHAHHQALHGTAAERGAIEKLEAARKQIKALHKEVERLRLLVDGDTVFGISGLRADVVVLEKETDDLEEYQEQKFAELVKYQQQRFDELEKREAHRVIRDELVTWSLRAGVVYMVFDLLRGLVEQLGRSR